MSSMSWMTKACSGRYGFCPRVGAVGEGPPPPPRRRGGAGGEGRRRKGGGAGSLQAPVQAGVVEGARVVADAAGRAEGAAASGAAFHPEPPGRRSSGGGRKPNSANAFGSLRQ